LRSGLPNGAFNEVHTIYAHSDPLQLWAETGVVGVAVVGWMVLRVARRPSMYWGPLAAFAVFSLTSFPSYAVAHLLAALACAGMALAAGGGERQDAVEGQGGAGWAVAAALVLCVLIAMGQTLPGYLSRRAAALHQKGRIEAVEAAYQRRLAYPWPAYEARRRYGILLLEEGRYEEAEDQFRAALEGLDTGGLYVGLSRALLEQARWEDAARAAEQAQWRWPGAVDPYVLLGASSLFPETGELCARARAWLEREELAALERALER
jgi:tetratricopeptide (TPR) repeat protein